MMLSSRYKVFFEQLLAQNFYCVLFKTTTLCITVNYGHTVSFDNIPGKTVKIVCLLFCRVSS